jgi:anti-sigma regulatory factor (Ser/Thr protein kinase)
MKNDIAASILNLLRSQKEARAAEIIKKTGFSRAYINRFFQALRNEGRIVLIGKANRARYVFADNEAVATSRAGILSVIKIIRNKNISEDSVLSGIKRDTGIFDGISRNVAGITGYAFSEMLNNAIEHSGSRFIKIEMKKDSDHVTFGVADNGIGIFNNIRRKKNLAGNMEAIQDLLKGKQTTSPEAHSGEGIFFTSRVADILTIRSSGKKLVYDNLLADVFIKDIRKTAGTKVNFSVNVKTKKRLDDIFREYTDSSFEFSKTGVIVRLYRMGPECISRSQARRIVSGLEKFKTVILDFKGMDTVGQAFADEIFRVWRSSHPRIDVISKNANDNMGFMIKRAMANPREVRNS